MKNWTERFDRDIKTNTDFTDGEYDLIKQFISTLLEEQKKEIGEEFKEWINDDAAKEHFFDVVKRITGVEI